MNKTGIEALANKFYKNLNILDNEIIAPLPDYSFAAYQNKKLLPATLLLRS